MLNLISEHSLYEYHKAIVVKKIVDLEYGKTFLLLNAENSLSMQCNHTKLIKVSKGRN